MGERAVTAWRAWGVRRDGSLTRCFITANADVWQAGWNRARCGRGHRAPAPDCWCGLHVVTGEAEVWSFVRARHRGSPWAVGRVECEGTALPSRVPNDPPGTLRVELARVVGPVVVLPSAEPLAPAIRERYGVPVIDQDLAGSCTGRCSVTIISPVTK